MKSEIVPKLRCVYEGFTFWTVSPSDTNPGCHVIAPHREIRDTAELRQDERIELFEKVVPYTERMIEAMHGECSIHERWQDGAFVLTPMTNDVMKEYVLHGLVGPVPKLKTSAA
jgi:hypothetical protein